jgi:hypothetical protein
MYAIQKMFVKLSFTINRRDTNNMGGSGVFVVGQMAGSLDKSV